MNQKQQFSKISVFSYKTFFFKEALFVRTKCSFFKECQQTDANALRNLIICSSTNSNLASALCMFSFVRDTLLSKEFKPKIIWQYFFLQFFVLIVTKRRNTLYFGKLKNFIFWQIKISRHECIKTNRNSFSLTYYLFVDDS